MRMRVTGAIISLILALVLVVPAFAAAAPNPGKAPPELERRVFVHHTKDVKPTGGGSSSGNLFSYSRYHWPGLPIHYYYNLTGSPVSDAEQGVVNSFQTWETDSGSSVDFDYKGLTNTLPGLDVSVPDYNNVVGWAALNDSGAIAVTIIWSQRITKYVVDCDTVFNLDSGFKWAQATFSDDPNTASLPSNTSAYDCDVQNIMTHEAGHWLVLDDLYKAFTSQQTMHGYAADREVKKRSLESGDIAGAQKIYP